MRSCVFAEDFVTKTRMAENDAAFSGTGVVVDHGMTTVGSGHAEYDTLLIDNFISIVVRFSATKTSAHGDLIADFCKICGPGDDGYAIWVDADGVKANHSNGVIPTECAVDMDYTDGVIHTVTYVVNMGAGTHKLYVDALDPDEQTTTVDEELGADNIITIGGHGLHYFSGTIYKARIFNVALTAEEHALYHAGTLETFLDNNLATYRCDSISDDSDGHKIRDRHVEYEDLYKADRVASAAFPTFDTDHYEFDLVDDYVSNVQTLPAAYTITAAENDPRAYPQIQQHNDQTFLDLLTTGGGYLGNLHSLLFHSHVLTQLELYHDEYQQLYWLWRGRAFGAYHRLITEETCKLAMFLDADRYVFRSYSRNPSSGVGHLVTRNGVDGCTFDSADSNVTVPDTADLRWENGTIVVYGLLEDIASGTLVDKGANYKLLCSVGGVLNFNGSTYDTGGSLTAVSQVAVTVRTGYKPRFYVDGEYVGIGTTTEAPDDTDTTDITIGNNNELNDATPYSIKQVYIGNQALTDREIKALYEEAQHIGATPMETGERVETRQVFADVAVDLEVDPGGPFQLIDVVLLLETAATTSEDLTIKSINASSDEVTEYNYDLSLSSDTFHIFRFDKRFADNRKIQIDYANTADHCDDITVIVQHQMDPSVT
jgi:hypothetical protein